MSKTRLTFYLAFILFASVVIVPLSACGGGGGEGSSLPFFGGVYRASFAIIENTCRFEQGSFGDVLTVNQVEQHMVADTRYGHYEGSPTGEDSFAVTELFRAVAPEGAQLPPRIRMKLRI